jgi:hypothetical protein
MVVLLLRDVCCSSMQGAQGASSRSGRPLDEPASQNIERPPVVISGGGARAIDTRTRARLEDVEGIYFFPEEEEQVPPDLKAEEHFPGLSDSGASSSRPGAPAPSWTQSRGAYCAPVGHRAHLDFPALPAHQPGTNAEAAATKPQSRTQMTQQAKQGRASRRGAGRVGGGRGGHVPWQNGFTDSSPLARPGSRGKSMAAEAAKDISAMDLGSAEDGGPDAPPGWLDRLVDDMSGRSKQSKKQQLPKPTADNFPALSGALAPVVEPKGLWGPPKSLENPPKRAAGGIDAGPSLSAGFPLLAGEPVPLPPGLRHKGSGSSCSSAFNQTLKVCLVCVVLAP